MASVLSSAKTTRWYAAALLPETQELFTTAQLQACSEGGLGHPDRVSAVKEVRKRGDHWIAKYEA